MGAWGRLLRAVLLGFDLVLFAGIALLPFDRRPAVFLMLATVIGLFAMHLTVGIVGYRRTMRRPWPSVPPIEDDDDDW